MPLRLPKQFHPDFSRPGVKPTGAVEIDWSNPLAKNLRYVFYKVSPGLLTRNSVTIDSAVNQAKDIYFDGTTGNSIKLDNDPAWTGESYTVISKAKYFGSGGGGFPAIWGKGDTSVGEAMLRINGTNIEFYSAGVPGSVALTNADGKQVTCVYNDSGATNTDRYQMYVDGIDQGIAGRAANDLTTTKRFEIGNADSGIATNREWKGWIEYVFVFDTNLNSTQVQSLAQDPYQILRPAQPMMLFVPAAGGTTYTLTADNTSFSVGGDTVNLQWGRIFSADVTSYTLGGDAVNLTYVPAGSYTLTADNTSYTLGSDAVNLFYKPVLSADVTSYVLGGDAVNLTYTPVGAYTLTADVTAYALSSDNVNLVYARIFTADNTSYTLTFGDAALTLGLLDTPNCYTWLLSQIDAVEWYNGLIDSSANYELSIVNTDVQYVQSSISDDVTYLNGDLC